MSKERLTKTSYNPCDECNYAFHKYNQESGMCKLCEFKNYRDLEEQGLLLRMPCKVGDMVYSFSFGEVFCAEIVEIKYICEAENYGKFIRQKITIDGEGCGITIIDFSDIGKRYFLTQSEAEEKLRELEWK